ncbi:TAXI family TRAP transporter solute-binding subunit [Halomonas heilongjiangensis]|uniref:C4-dicarboxylate ABC transporter substrate-binding protein n=1 Tax=Halomonas heilongjiangensis TaxID=1387883 RepID=A0A2N7TPZ3_9GAMM|nr:TAXI family TRAP transporter solute-binding subunit [Halomonas heilongjiangensis]PMR70256.1 C4-dicarboxylate ABC transporter substrate-binding protein [Halomonas heilongjiangensis]PXX87275.1 C4-dicarboxylate ABC transporter substrate-binding protein [Halomonas heilongjiangensis]
MKIIHKIIPSILAAALIIGHAHAATVGIGSNPQGSVAYSSASAIARVVSENSDHRMRVVPQGGPETTIPMVNDGAMEFSVSNAVDAIYAVRGQEIFEGREYSNMKVVAALFPLNVGFFVHESSDIHNIADLAGKRVPIGFGRQQGLLMMSRAMLATEQLSEDDINGVFTPSGTRGIQDFIAGRTDAAVFSVGSGAVAEANASVGGIRFLSLSDTPEELETIRGVTPGAFIATLSPAPNLPGIIDETNVWMTPFVLLASDNTPDDLVYEVTRLIHDHAESLASAAAVFKSFDPMNMMVELEDIEYHSGALKFYEEIEEP